MPSINWVNIAGVATVALALFAPGLWKKVQPILSKIKLKPAPTPPQQSGANTPAGNNVDQYARSRQTASDFVTALLADQEFDLATQATQLAAQIGRPRPTPEKPPLYTGTKSN